MQQQETTTENQEQQHHAKIERFERALLVPLTDKEKSALADRSAFLLGEIEQLIEEKKNASKQAQNQIDERKAELRKVSTEYRDGKKFEKVKCERRLLFRLNSYQEVRTDTGEIIFERPLTDRERQLSLPGAEGEASAAGDDDGIVDDDYNPEGATKLESSEPALATEKPKRRRKRGEG